MAGYQWKPIEDLPDNWRELSSSEIEALFLAWKEQGAHLRESELLKEFSQRLRREWAIETGIIENLYSIDRGTTQLLIEQGIHTESRTEIVVSIHAVGEEFLRIMAVSAFSTEVDLQQEVGPVIRGPDVLCSVAFQFTTEEPDEEVLKRFEPWLERVIVAGLEQWRKQL